VALCEPSRESPGARAKLSLQGTIRNTGDPAFTVMGLDGGGEQGKTEVNHLNGSRESDHLIVAMSRRSLEGITKGHNDVW